jgi:hypothetical protein
MIQEAIQKAFPRKFKNINDIETEVSGIIADQIAEQLLQIVLLESGLEKLRDFNRVFALQFDQLRMEGKFEEVLGILERKYFVGTESPHGDNRYKIFFQYPKRKPANQLIALQYIPPYAQENSPHNHLRERRIEDIIVLKGDYQINFYNYQGGRISYSRIINPLAGVIIDPRRYHSVNNFGNDESIALILGTTNWLT